MLDLLDLHKYFILSHLKPGDCAVDYTMGNGHDTEFLSKTGGENGRVFAFDIQPNALNSTKARLVASGCPDNYTLLCVSHHRAAEFVDRKVRAGMFNLGYLPGSDKKITTMHETTLAAIDAAISLMDSDAIVLIAIYPGHAEGELEGRLVGEKLSALDRRQYTVGCFKLINSPTSPYFYIVEGH